jgi:hypothetical protein
MEIYLLNAMNFKTLIPILLLFISLTKVNAQIEKIGIKSFLDNSISKKEYAIDFLEKSLLNNSYNHSLILNKAVRFKMYLDAQEFSSNLYSKNCNLNSSQIAITNVRIKNTFQQGVENANYLFKVAEQKEPSFAKEYDKIFNEQTEMIGSFLKYSDLDCNSVLADLQMRNQGIFTDEKLGNNVLSFNYILNPVEEIMDNHTQEFSSINNASDEDFFFTIDLPRSWSSKAKKDFSNVSTVGFYEPYEKFLDASITASILSKQFISKEEMKSQNISDNDIVDFIFEDDETLITILKIFNSKISNNKIKCTLYNNGKSKMIFYNSYTDLGKATKNEILEGQVIEYFGAINIKNGKVININGGALKSNGFNSYDYYSKLFFKVITSIKFKDIKKNTLYLTEEQNMKFIQLNFSGLNYKFMLDTGASNVVINKNVLSDLLSNGVVSKENYIGDSLAEIADGSMIACQNWLVPELKIGNQIIKNLTVSVTDSENSMLLFGMDGLKKLNVLKLNLTENEIILNRE